MLSLLSVRLIENLIVDVPIYVPKLGILSRNSKSHNFH